MNWLDTEIHRKYHEAASIFPLMQGDDYEALKTDIAVHGLREAIWLHPDGSIVDGRNRHRACIELELEPRFRQWDGDGSLVAFIVSLNLHRRHLTSSQRAVIALDILPMLEKEAKERMIAGGLATTKQGSQRIDYPVDEQGKATQQAAELLNTNRQYVSDAKSLQQDAPDLLEQVRTGEKTMPQAKREARERSRPDPPPPPEGKFYLIYADPPWKYDFALDSKDAIENHYPTMPIEEICAMRVPAHDDCVLFLWATPPKLPEALRTVEAWGFTYKTCMVWDKDWIGPGYYARQQHELLLIATKGSPSVPLPENRPASVYIERRTEHSKKPDEFYEIIERMYPQYANEESRIELFARQKRDRWSAWGNEI